MTPFGTTLARTLLVIGDKTTTQATLSQRTFTSLTELLQFGVVVLAGAGPESGVVVLGAVL